MDQIDQRLHIGNWLQRNQTTHTILGDVTIYEKIGEGGSSVVHGCTWPGRLPPYRAVIKFLVRPESFKYAERFSDEYKKLIEIAYEGAIVPLYHFGIQDMGDIKVPYIIMQRCNFTLENVYGDKKLVDEGEFRSLLDRLLHILKTIHDAGIIHRDIKPSNILQRPNGEWVLSDFGIASYNSSIYENRVETGKDERLANFDFSAPEQSRRDAYSNPTPSMDIYALGQTLYSCVTDRTIKGSGYRPLSWFSLTLSKYDPLIDKMVRQEPSERFQSIEEIQEFLSRQKQRKKRSTLTKAETFERQRIAFNVALRQSVSLHERGCFRIDNQEEIRKIMSSLASCYKKCNLSWIVGYEKGLASPVEEISQNNGWLIGPYECNISTVVVHRDFSIPFQYVLLHLAPLPRFEKDSSENENYSFSRYYKGLYITEQEFKDKQAIINEKSVTIKNAQLRKRNLKDDFLFLIPHDDPFNQDIHRPQIYSVYLNLRHAEEVDYHKLTSPFKGMMMCSTPQSDITREKREIVVMGEKRS